VGPESGSEALTITQGNADLPPDVAWSPEDVDELIDIARGRLTRSLTDAECQQYLHVESCSA